MLDLLYGQVAGARRRWYERHPEARYRLQQPVISVGNLTVGGTGKTPLVGQIAAWLRARGERPAILSRGYKRRVAAAGVAVVSDGSALYADGDTAGDEPLMLARQVPGAIVCVCEERHVAGALAERVLGATVHILDDGFQHVQLARDCDLLVTAPGESTGGRVLPFGRLREARVAAARAHFAVVVGADNDVARAEAWELGISAFSAAHRRPGSPSRPHAASASAEGSADSERSRSRSATALAVTGIGKPEQFFEMLRQAAIELKDTIAFPDHHRYTAADVSRIERALKASGAPVVMTTEKDAVRFEPFGKLPFELVAVPMRLELEEWEALAALVAQSIERARGAA